MSEERFEPQDEEDRVILDLLDARDGGRVSGRVTQSELAREYVEVLGLLPAALPEVAPAPGVRNRMLEAVAGLGRHPTGSDLEAVSAPRGRWMGWRMPLAAGIALATMAVTAWLVVQVRDQRLLIAELTSELARTRSIASALSASRQELALAHSRIAMVTERGTEFCALAPPEGSPAAGAHGLVMMHHAREEWFLRIEGLAPCPAGRTYVVWFATDTESVPGPAFIPNEGEAVELTITGHPKGIKAIMVTLESEPAPSAPSTAPILFGNERMKLL